MWQGIRKEFLVTLKTHIDFFSQKKNPQAAFL